jgi:transglutaminase-like putative cysteine protease
MRGSRATALELVVFGAFAWYAAAHWASGLVADTPDGRVLACVAVSLAVAAAVSLSAAAPAPLGTVLRVCCTIAGFGAACIAVGLDRRLLAPDNWDELGDGLDRGFAALGTVQWPYDGSEPWAALTILLALPVVLTPAAVCAFWAGRAGRPAALVMLIALYTVPVVERDLDGELARGLGLLLLVALWLWLPRATERGWRAGLAAAATVLVAGVAALPAAARYDDREPWIAYEAWNPFAAQAATRFDWSHSYGPIDWPREGTTLMYVRSEQRHYWRVETLDRFDGYRWVRSRFGRGAGPLLPDPYRTGWETTFRVTIRDLDSDLFPVAGTALRIRGADPVAVATEDGTVEAAGESLDEGESYSVDAYVPDPTPAQMRAAPRGAGELLPYVPAPLVRYTQVLLPPDTGAPATPEEILASPYARARRLAQRLARGQPTAYDIVRAVQNHLRTRYTYNERPPSRQYPLAAFLFQDRNGYCQQFSGAMALMLRMLGIPARVAAGFTPGSYNRDTGEYRVRDLDAHSWVEVWFTGVGWVPFDPTPSIAPAESQSSADAASASGGPVGAGETQDLRGRESTAADEGGGAGGAARDRDRPLASWIVALAMVLLAAGALATLRVAVLVARGREPVDDEAELAALRRVVACVGEPIPPRTTLRQLERRLGRLGGLPAARYARWLRERRFAAHGGSAPDRGARRDLRRALTRGRGLRVRLAALVAMPPVPFRRG